MIATAISSCCLVVAFRLLTPIPSIAQPQVNLLVSAAASLEESLKEIAPIYAETKQNVTIRYNFGASGALQQQIEQGAPADIFISAARKQMDALETKGLLVAGTRTNMARNRLVLIVPQSQVGITSFYDLPSEKISKIAIGEPRSVPAGQYAEQVLNKLRIWPQIRSKLVLANNVRQVLAAVETGNADAGIVYATDAKISDKVKVVVAADEKLHSPIVYPMAAIKSSKNISAAQQFLEFLSSNRAKTILKKYGFIVN